MSGTTSDDAPKRTSSIVLGGVKHNPALSLFAASGDLGVVSGHRVSGWLKELVNRAVKRGGDAAALERSMGEIEEAEVALSKPWPLLPLLPTPSGGLLGSAITR